MSDQSPGATIDFLGLLAYAEFSAFTRLVSEAAMAPTLDKRIAMASLASREFDHHKQIAALISNSGHDPLQCMQAFASTLDSVHARTEPHSWGECLVKVYTLASLGSDVFSLLEGQTSDVIAGAVRPDLSEDLAENFVKPELVALLETDPAGVGALSLWGRRLLGELLSQVSRVAMERPDITAAVMGGEPAEALAAYHRMTAALIEKHSKRFRDIGLAP